MEVEPGDTLFGLYQGTPLPERSWSHRQHAARSHLDLPAADRRGLRGRGRDPRLRRGDRHPRVRPLLRHERRGDRGDRGEVLARRVDRGRRLSDAHAEAIRPALPRARRGPTRSSRRSRRSRDERFLEIGPGPGALTLRLAPRVAHLTAIEVDRDLAAELRAASSRPTSTLVVADFLEVDLAPFVAGRPVPRRREPALQHLVADPVPADRAARPPRGEARFRSSAGGDAAVAPPGPR